MPEGNDEYEGDQAYIAGDGEICGSGSQSGEQQGPSPCWRKRESASRFSARGGRTLVRVRERRSAPSAPTFHD